MTKLTKHFNVFKRFGLAVLLPWYASKEYQIWKKELKQKEDDMIYFEHTFKNEYLAKYLKGECIALTTEQKEKYTDLGKTKRTVDMLDGLRKTWFFWKRWRIVYYYFVGEEHMEYEIVLKSKRIINAIIHKYNPQAHSVAGEYELGVITPAFLDIANSLQCIFLSYFILDSLLYDSI